MKKAYLIVVFCICAVCLLVVYSVSVQRNLADNLLRFHIVANSNSVIDQSVKLGLRDEILDFVREKGSYPDFAEISRTAHDYLEKINSPYDAVVSCENCYVPMKSYKSIALPGGRYDCVRVVLGDGKGENWWCIAYPPLCYTESMFGDLSPSGIKELEGILDDEALLAIAKDGKINFRLKIVDRIQGMINKIREKKAI